MCGICGIYSLEKGGNPDKAVVRGMASALAHRGPDAEGVAEFPGCILGHRRLAVIDLAGGTQPFSSTNGRFAISYNGEIYNHREIRTILAKLGHSFRTSCDTETVLAAYAEWGADCLARFNGMFAFAVYDAERHELFLARDRLGVKPLFYSACGGDFAFASELHALLLHPRFNKSLDPVSINH